MSPDGEPRPSCSSATRAGRNAANIAKLPEMLRGRPTGHRRSAACFIARDHAGQALPVEIGRTITSPISSDPGWYEPMPAAFYGLPGPRLHGAIRRTSISSVSPAAIVCAA